MSEVIKNAES